MERAKSEDSRPRGLGRGLSALIGDEAVPVKPEPGARKPSTLPTGFLVPGKFQPRKRFNEEELRELSDSIREKGLLQPILVRPAGTDPPRYEIIAGERRWRAAQLARLHEVPVAIREASDGEALELAIIENVQREDLNAIEEAAAYHELMDRFRYTQEQVAQVVGKSRSHVANTIRLLRLPEAVKTMLREGELSAGHARTLLAADDPEARAREIIAGAMNVRDAEQRSQAVRKVQRLGKEADPNIRELESSLSNWLGLKVQILARNRNGGELRIAYKTLEQLDDVIHRLKRAV
ncbi:MAG: ParB/RepB/Spo0J family partition protein [Alphaproteobacteria bacterium]|nr:ParB/RepB/Spo0J family partition protein [Alphaproteobacteria bacterium]